MNTKRINLSPEISFAIEALNKRGYEAYVVGGAVRDFIMGNPVSDYDMSTDATPDELHSIFDKCIDTGISHGTVTVIINHVHIEITTFRTDGSYTDHRRPDKVLFSKKLDDDLSRRDFTINALAYNPAGGIVDLFGGITDIQNKILRCVGNAEKRFEEDALRMLRLIRFCTKLGFDADKSTLSALINKESLITYVSRERIREEIIKTFNSDFPEKIFLFRKSRILDYIFGPGFFDKINEPIIHNMKALSKKYIIRLSYIINELYPHDNKMIRQIISSLRFSNKDKRNISAIILFVREFIGSYEAFNDKYTLKKAIAKYSPELVSMSFDILKFYKDISATKELFEEIERNHEPYLISHLTINGKNLISMGFEGADTGRCLEHLQEMVTKNPKLNTKEILIREAKDFYEKKCICKN